MEHILGQETVCIDLVLPSHKCIKSVLLMETLTSLELQWTGRIKILKFAAAVNVIFSFWFFWLAAGSGLTSEQDEVSWSFFLVLSQYGLSDNLGIQG